MRYKFELLGPYAILHGASTSSASAFTPSYMNVEPFVCRPNPTAVGAVSSKDMISDCSQPGFSGEVSYGGSARLRDSGPGRKRETEQVARSVEKISNAFAPENSNLHEHATSRDNVRSRSTLVHMQPLLGSAKQGGAPLEQTQNLPLQDMYRFSPTTPQAEDENGIGMSNQLRYDEGSLPRSVSPELVDHEEGERQALLNKKPHSSFRVTEAKGQYHKMRRQASDMPQNDLVEDFDPIRANDGEIHAINVFFVQLFDLRQTAGRMKDE